MQHDVVLEFLLKGTVRFAKSSTTEVSSHLIKFQGLLWLLQKIQPEIDN